MPHPSDHLRSIHNFDELIQYLEDKLGWPLQEYGFDDLTFQYDAEELGLKEEDAAKVKAIHQLRPLQHGQPWGIFFVEFEKKKLPVVVLRRILSHLVVKKRASANRANEAAWHSEDLLFVTAFGEDDTIQREIAFAHFHQSPGDLPTLRVLGWDGGDTPLKLSYVDKVLQERLHWPEDPSDHKAWRQQWRAPFKHRIGHVIRTADSLAEAMAALARGINDKATRMLAAESDSGPLKKLHKAFQAALIHDLTEESFADTYAQTITYGLLTAAISRTEGSEGRHGTFIIAENVTDMVPITNPFLREMLQTFLKVGGRKGGIDFDELGIQDVVDLLRGDETDLPAILRDFGNKTQGEDPVIHFYEHFLAAYNKKLKVQRGVFYTPKPVVSYIVRSVHELLQTEFGLEDGLASTVTWGEMAKKFPELKIPAGVSPDSPFVMVLDPATGTATFLVEVIDVIHKTMLAKWQKLGKREQEIGKLWNEYIPKHLLPRIYGYELMMAPYAIAHMKIGLKLFETGYQFMSDERVRVYLTNALEPASDDQQKLVGIVPALAHEAEAVNAVKRNVRFTLAVGNPPYSGESMNAGEWIRGLIDTYMFVDGVHLGEKGKKNWLQDDYVKFIRFSQFELDKSGVGILGFINNHGFLDNPTFRGMRASLLKSFSSIHVLDLHGNSKKKERGPDGDMDANVFDIQQGVSIELLWRRPIKNDKMNLGHAHLLGPRGEVQLSKSYGKYSWLAQHSDSTTNWSTLNPDAPFYLFIPQNINLRSEYESCWKLTEAMPFSGSGITTSRDHFVIDFEDAPLRKRLELFRDEQASDDFVRKELEIDDNSMWSMSKARKEFRKMPIRKNLFADLLYRPFDIRRIYFETNVVFNMRIQVMKHLLEPNLSLITIRRVEIDRGFEHVFCANQLSVLHSVSLKEANVVIPLFLYPDDNDQQQDMLASKQRLPNFAHPFIKSIAVSLGLPQKSASSLPVGIEPKEIFYYIYSFLHCPTYRTRYAEFLKIDFPRIPLTSSLELFRSLAKLGGKLVALHLLESPVVNNFITTYTGKGDNSIPKKPTWKENAVWINPTQRFEGVPETVWNFHIGGYQVCEKWLKDRKGRNLTDDDITHYQSIVVALSETIRIMAEIDEVIDEHGGWPLQGSVSGVSVSNSNPEEETLPPPSKLTPKIEMPVPAQVDEFDDEEEDDDGGGGESETLTSRELEEAIARVEGFPVRLVNEDGRRIRADRGGFAQYPYERALRGDYSVSDWKETRFYRNYDGIVVEVLNADDESVHGRTLLRNVRS